MASVVQFKTRFPEFDSTLDARVQLFLDDCALLMGTPSRWLDFYDIANQYFAAHFLSIADGSEAGDSGISMPIASQEVDDVIIKQAVSESHPSITELLSTVYGKRYWQYRRIVFVGIYGV